MTRQAGGTQYIYQNDTSHRIALEFNYNGTQIIYKQGQYLQ